MIRVGLVGLGYWGPNLARVLQQARNCALTACCDTDSRTHAKIARQYPTVRLYQACSEMWNDVDAVMIATPISTHFSLAKEAIRHGKHIFVEKPLAQTSQECSELISLANREGVTLMCGHTFAYSPAVRKVKELIESGALGELHYISLSRVNLGLYQKDVDVIWDLAVHDISILLFWLGQMPSGGVSFGRACIQKDKNDVAFIWLKFPSGIIASIEISWLSPQKMRRTSVVGSNKMIVYDDTEASEKIKIYDRGVMLHTPETFGEFQLSYRIGDMVAPTLDNVEPLLTEVQHFLDCIEQKQTPLTGGIFGANVVKVLEMIAATPFLGSEATKSKAVSSSL